MSILIGLLKIIGIILALLLVIICIIIFCGINLKLSFNNKEKISYFVKLTYLFGLFSYTLNSENNLNTIKILGINIDKFKKNKDISKKEKTKKKKQKDKNLDEDIELKNNQQLEENINNEKENINLEDNNKIKESNKENKFEKFKSKIYYFKIKVNNIINQIKFIVQYPDKKEILKLSLLLLKRLLKAIKFRKIKINIDYGLDEPFKTGNVCGIISAIIPFLPKRFINDIKILPDFENQLFLANIEIKCKTSLFKILLPIILFISKKPIRKIIFSKGE